MQKREQLIVGNLLRDFLIYFPKQASENSLLPVVISLHGTLGSAEQMMAFADFRPLAEKEGFLIVCPEGITQTWNDGRATKAYKAGIDDVTFLDQLITHLTNNYPVDAQRIYMTGMSNGGFMTSRLVCELPDRIAAIAVVAATLDRVSALKPLEPMPVMYIHGTKDRIVPYSGGATKAAGGDVFGHNEILQLLADINGCNNPPETNHLPDSVNDGTSIIKNEYTNPTTGIKVIGYTIVNGGHTWPDGPQYAPVNFVGLVSHNLNACEAIWSFFKSCKIPTSKAG